MSQQKHKYCNDGSGEGGLEEGWKRVESLKTQATLNFMYLLLYLGNCRRFVVIQKNRRAPL